MPNGLTKLLDFRFLFVCTSQFSVLLRWKKAPRVWFAELWWLIPLGPTCKP